MNGKGYSYTEIRGKNFGAAIQKYSAIWGFVLCRNTQLCGFVRVMQKYSAIWEFVL